MRNISWCLVLASLLAGCGSGDSVAVPTASTAVALPLPPSSAPQPVPPAALFELARSLQPSPGANLAQQAIARGKLMTTNLVKVRAGQAVQRHFHPNYEECFYVLAGTAQLQLGQSVFPIQAGDFVFLPIGVAHGVTADLGQDLLLYTNTAPPFTGEGHTLLAPGEPGPVTQVELPPL